MPERKRDEEKIPQRYPFIAVVGPVGIGKTTFTGLVVNGTGITQFQELYKENPYLNNFYTGNPADYSFDSQMFFLANKGIQAKRIRDLTKNGPVIQDPGVEVDFMIAETQWKMRWMSDEEHNTYVSAFNNVFKDCLKPDIYIALKADENTVIERIVKRGREMELTMLQKYPEYFPMLVWEFDRWLNKKQKDSGGGVWEIDACKNDFVSDRKEEIIAEAKNWLSYFISAPTQRNMIGSDGARLVMPNSFRITPHLVDYIPGAKKYY